MKLHTQFLSDTIPYTGAELTPHWISARTHVYESSIVAFQGECHVNVGELVDQEDAQNQRFIRSAKMLHFLGEWFADDLTAAIARQRLFIAGFAEILQKRLKSTFILERSGNDLFIVREGKRAKLSVSIVTASPVSTLFHFGVNVDAKGAPVDAIGLQDLGIDPQELAQVVLRAWQEEWQGIWRARCKVVPR